MNLWRVVRAEWTKLFALRSTWVVLGVMPQVLAGVSALIGWNSGSGGGVTQAVGGGFLVYAVVVGGFGVVTMTGEYGSGLIGATFAAVPRRLPVLWAKGLVLVAATGPVMVVAYLLAFLTFTRGRIGLGEPGVVSAIFGAAGATVLVGVLGLGVGALVRHTAVAVSAYLAVLVLLPPVLLGALPQAVGEVVLPYLPTAALQAMYQVGDGGSPMLAPLAGGLVAMGWVAVVMAGAAVALLRRDV